MDLKKKFHFIAIASSETYHLAAALQKLGHDVTTSDDQITGEVQSRLEALKLMPERTGWAPERMTKDYDAVIIGTQTNKSNPELIKAQQLGLKIYTGPEYTYEFSRNKQRLVVVGTNGRALIASLIVHVLQYLKRPVDYILADGDEKTISLSSAPLIVIDGSESRSSAVYHTPQFIKYRHHIGVLAEIVWEPTSSLSENDFIRQFDLFADATPKAGVLIYAEQDKIASVICNKERADVTYVPYKSHPSAQEGGKDFVIDHHKERIPVKMSGKQNFLYVGAALEALKKIGVTQDQFYKAIATF